MGKSDPKPSPPPAAPSAPPSAPPPPPPAGGPVAAPPPGAAPATRGRSLIKPVALQPRRPGRAGKRIGLYGPGGVGKTTAASRLPSPYFLDGEDSTEELSWLGERVDPFEIWAELRGKVMSFMAAPPSGVESLVIDNLTVAQEYVKRYTCENLATSENAPSDPQSVDEFYFNKGWDLVYDEFLNFLSDLEAISRRGIHVCCVVHSVTSMVPSPANPDGIMRWEPSLHAGSAKGKASLRMAFQNWCTHLVFANIDIVKNKSGVAVGGSRSMYTVDPGFCMAKGRGKQLMGYPFTADAPGAVWDELGITKPPENQ